ncbi:MAG: FAD-binding protein [Candidatus Hermodarchaeia archaeon]|jgi:succinate dehydrogenase / fumarate reductase flavoprotein subunit
MSKLIRGYPEYIRETIEQVARTRDHRLKNLEKIYNDLRMSLEERNEILTKFHPDFKEGGKRPVKIGPSKGDLMPNEFADLIEAHPFIKPDEVDLTDIDYDCDILIIGGGGAGTVAALWANHEGVPVEDILMVTKLRHGDCNSMMAQGGIQAADTAGDSPTRHYLDAIGGGHFTNNIELVKGLTRDGPLIISWLEELGVMFDRNEDGSFSLLAGGGTSFNRMHSAKDYTGMELLRVLRDEFLNRDIPCIEFAPAVELLLDSYGKAAGAVLMNLETDQYYVVRAKATILATGGFGRLHVQGFATTNHYGATADGLIMAYHAGVPLVDMDSVQYHPTGAAYPQQIVGLLITEKVRSMGAQPVNRNGDSFVYPLEPRDVESSAIIRECYERNLGVTTPTGFRGCWLDSPMIEILRGEGAIERDLGAMYRMFDRFGIDMTEDPILVFPTLHYQNGGMMIDANATTPISGLFSGGENEGGVHGKNRLMGNSLLDYTVYGRRAGISAAKYVKSAKRPKKLSLAHLNKYEAELQTAGIDTDRKAPLLLPDYREKQVLNRIIDYDFL